jgi:nicotinate dehydrogenase subunit B
MHEDPPISRRSFLASCGALVVSFSLFPILDAAEPMRLPGSLDRSPMLDSWIRIAGDGSITVFTGKVELGQGIKTALIQLAADELGVEIDRVTLITADTAPHTERRLYRGQPLDAG